MTIDEAIAHAREVAEKNRNFDVIPEKVMATSTFKYNCLKCAEEHEQLAEWLVELKRWHKSGINPKIKNVFANTSTLICHNCDHKDEYIEELEAEMEEYRAIGTPEECQAAVEKQKAKKPSEQSCEEATLFKCSNCGCIMKVKYYDGSVFGHSPNYCEQCGQKMDWSDDDERNNIQM